MSASRSIRLDAKLIEAAEVEGETLDRSAARPIEFWAAIGRRLGPMLFQKDLLAIVQGLARLDIETEPSNQLNPAS